MFGGLSSSRWNSSRWILTIRVSPARSVCWSLLTHDGVFRGHRGDGPRGRECRVRPTRRPQEAVGRKKTPGRCGPAPGVFPKPCDGRKALRQGRPKAVVGGRNLTRSGRPHRLAGLYHQSRSPAVDHPSAPRRAGSRASSGASVSDAMMRGCPSMIGVACSLNPVKPASAARRRSPSAPKPQ